MATSLSNAQQLFALLVFILSVFGSFDSAEAADAGNVLAALIGVAIGIICICAALGWWSRRQA
eukprot:CAMPEP_0196782586 /NCGR_PEP_ID=MMETSP1104-20130614/11644_1 /TAXON_ID=33652 /ORGANISM="Cafeteria sp., Strain Caron Lab Isolate" /LENGTH=62 /DNA_ID=CAMNT_0042152825 /DNA_START=21 /DNA_END=209 /DNA_ORIENTATION=+